MELFGVKIHHLEGSYLMTKNEIDRIIAEAIWYIKNPLHKEKFGPIALGLYDLHRELNPVYKKYDKGPLTDWREIPLMPISEFKHNDVGLVMSDRMPFPGVEFHSSGTTQGDKSKHRMYDTEAYRAAIAHGFQKEITYTPFPKYRVVLLTPKLPNSSLYYMMSLFSELYDPRGIREQFEGMTDPERVKSFIELDLAKEEEPVLLFGTSLAFYDLMTTINDYALAPFELPIGSMIIETGGWKGRDIKLTASQLTARVSDFFQIGLQNCIREYSMSEISSQLWAWGNESVPTYYAPEWMNVRMVDPLSQTEMPLGESGIISFVDLANVWSCPFILTEDMGHAIPITGGPQKIVLEGRAVNAPEKGCSLTYAQAMDS